MNHKVKMTRHAVISVSLAAILGISGPIWAESPPPFPTFEAKRLKPPAKGSKNRIIVQIDETIPQVEAESSPVSEETPAPSPTSLYEWFWEAVAPQTNETGPTRLELAINALSSDEGRAALSAPRLNDVQGLAKAYGTDLLLATVGTEVSPAFALAVIYVESRGKADAVSSAGAQGLMQLIPATADRFGVEDAFDATQNIKGGVTYLDFLMKEFDGDPVLALAGYNAGENAVKKHAGVPPYAETRNYVPRVLSAFSVIKGLCITPPLYASDGCVFANLK